MKEEALCTIPTPDNCSNYKAWLRIERPKILAEGKRKVGQMFRKKSAARFSKLGFQGEMLQFLEEQEMDIGWKSTIYRVLRGLMSWAVPAGTNSLATVDNLSRWGRPVNPECDMPGCDSVCSLHPQAYLVCLWEELGQV